MRNTGERYDKGGLVVITFLLLFGIFFIYFSWGQVPISYDSVYKYIYKHGFEAIISFFFIFVSFFGWSSYIRNVIIKPKEKTLYLYKIDDNTGELLYIFLDKKGNIYYHSENNDKNLIEGLFYKVMKTKDNVKSIINISTESFDIPKPKEKFFLTWYSPMGKFENIMLLPIVYVILIPCILSILMATGFDKIYGVILGAFPTYLIIYDLYHKFLNNK